jgi:hypothetical protein
MDPGVDSYGEWSETWGKRKRKRGGRQSGPMSDSRPAAAAAVSEISRQTRLICIAESINLSASLQPQQKKKIPSSHLPSEWDLSDQENHSLEFRTRPRPWTVGELKREFVPIPLTVSPAPCVPARVLTDAVVKIILRIRLLFASATATRAHVPSDEMARHWGSWNWERERVTGVPIPILPFVVPDELPLPAAAARILVHWLELEEESVILRMMMMRMSVLCSK